MKSLCPALAQLPPLQVSVTQIQDLFASSDSELSADLPNPHIEPQVSAADKAHARAAAVLMLLVDEPRPALLLTRRSPNLRFAGHQVFPGGISDATDATPLATMLREVREEIGLCSHQFDVFGRFGDYYTHSGFRIAAFVGRIAPPLELHPNPAEVDQVSTVPLDVLLNPANYQLRERSLEPRRANYFLEHGDIHLTGPTISLIISMYRALSGHCG
jgi:8-oxo-dGTP pyrophosphatase MutT (NUDIX family)